MEITQAVAQLDPSNNAHWTDDGQPRLDFLSHLVGANVERQAVLKVAPTLTRATAKAPPAAAPTAAAAPPAAEPPTKAKKAKSRKTADVPTEPTDAAFVVPKDDVLGKPFDEVVADAELTTRAVAEVGHQMGELGKRHRAITDKMGHYSALTIHLQRAQGAHKKESPGDLLNRLNKSQADAVAHEEQRKANAINALREQTGLNAEDIQSAVGAAVGGDRRRHATHQPVPGQRAD